MLRSKPTPIPAIRPVPEYAADDTLSAVYARTMDGFGVPWMGADIGRAVALWLQDI